MVRYRLTSLSLHLTIDDVNLLDPDSHDLLHLDDDGDVLSSGTLYHNGAWTNLKNTSPDPDYNGVDTVGINDGGTVAGDIFGDSSGAYTIYFGDAVVWQHGHMRVVGSPPDADETAAAINNHGDVLITSADQDMERFTDTTLFYSGDKQIIVGFGRAECINDKDQVIYQSQPDPTSAPDGDILLWTSGHTQAIRVPTCYGSTILSVARLNDRGQVVGLLDTGQTDPVSRNGSYYTDITHAFLWKEGMTGNLGTLGGEDSGAADINDRSQVVGWAETARPDRQGKAPTHAFLWERGRMYDLNDLIPARSGWVLQRADAINSRGQIVGVGNKGAFLLTPL